MVARLPLRRRLGRLKDRFLHKVSRIRQPQPIITEPLLEARADNASRPGLGSLPVEDLLERISELEATYHLTMKLWAYPQLRKSRYWDRRKIWVVIDQMGQAEEAISLHMREAESAFRALSARSPPTPRSLFHEASLQLPGAYPKDPAPPPEASGSSSPTTDPAVLPRAAATKFLTGYYLSLSEIRDNLKQWRAGLKAMADQV